MLVTVTMAYWNVGPTVRRAVESILSQTYPHWRLVIVNDADPNPPWQWLEDINDPRVVRFDLGANRGRYYIDSVIWKACQPEAWALQDPDDYSEPDRFENMVPLAEEFGAGFAPTMWHKFTGPQLSTKRLYDQPRTDLLEAHIGYGSGVITADRIRHVGGFHPGYRIGYDTLMHTAVKATGPWSVYDLPLQNKVQRRGSLTMARRTKIGSPARKRVRKELDVMYRKVVATHLAGGDPSGIVPATVPDSLTEAVSDDAARLRELL